MVYNMLVYLLFFVVYDYSIILIINYLLSCCNLYNSFCCSISRRSSSSVGINGMYLAAKRLSLSCKIE